MEGENGMLKVLLYEKRTKTKKSLTSRMANRHSFPHIGTVKNWLAKEQR